MANVGSHMKIINLLSDNKIIPTELNSISVNFMKLSLLNECKYLFSVNFRAVSAKKMSDDSDSEEKQLQFHQMELDDRILKAIALLGWLTPTLIQEKAIPLLIEGKDVLLRAKTGSGEFFFLEK